jgi:hypothetical protein
MTETTSGVISQGTIGGVAGKNPKNGKRVL